MDAGKKLLILASLDVIPSCYWVLYYVIVVRDCLLVLLCLVVWNDFEMQNNRAFELTNHIHLLFLVKSMHLINMIWLISCPQSSSSQTSWIPSPFCRLSSGGQWLQLRLDCLPLLWPMVNQNPNEIASKNKRQLIYGLDLWILFIHSPYKWRHSDWGPLVGLFIKKL